MSRANYERASDRAAPPSLLLSAFDYGRIDVAAASAYASASDREQEVEGCDYCRPRLMNRPGVCVWHAPVPSAVKLTVTDHRPPHSSVTNYRLPVRSSNARQIKKKHISSLVNQNISDRKSKQVNNISHHMYVHDIPHSY